MSLVQHVSQLEGQDRDEALVDLFLPPLERAESVARSERRLSLGSGFDSNKSIRRHASYDFLKPPEETVENYGGVTQYTVSTAKRIAQVITTVLACWFASGIVFGFAALKPILIQENVYQDLCTPEELEKGVEVCFEQDLRLNFFFSLASTTANLSALPVGALLDRYGPRLCFLLGCSCLAAGSILMSLAFQIDEFDGYTIGNFFLALGGNFIFLPSFQIANAFPKYAGTIVALVTGAFDASAAMFLFARLIYDATDRAFKPQHFFLAYLFVPFAILLAQLTFLPTESYKTPGQLQQKLDKAEDAMRDVHSSDDELSDDEMWRRRKMRSNRRKRRQQKLDKLVGSPDRRRRLEEREEHRQDAAGVWGALHNKPPNEQMMTPWFYLLTLLTTLQMIRMNYFIATVREQYLYMLSSIELATRINDFFDWALPVGGVISTPFLGILLDNVFGYATFGRVYGTIIFFSGVINLSQTGIAALTKTAFHGNPIPVNIFLAVAAFVVGVALVTYVTVQTYRMQMKLQDEDAMTVTNTDVGSIMESLLEEDEPHQGYGSIAPPRQSYEY
ncbi:hypothetical protein PMIN04_010130 [Paraphaeosphaeria minitans]